MIIDGKISLTSAVSQKMGWFAVLQLGVLSVSAEVFCCEPNAVPHVEGTW